MVRRQESVGGKGKGLIEEILRIFFIRGNRPRCYGKKRFEEVENIVTNILILPKRISKVFKE